MARTGTFKRFNGTEWVDYYFRTTPEMVIGLTTILNNLATLNTDQTITGTKTIVDKDFHMDGGSVNYIRPNTTGGWARGFWWSKRSTDNGGATRIGGIGVLGSDQSVTKFYIGFGASPWSSSAFEVYSSYINVKGLRINNVPLATVATSGSYNDLSNKPTIPPAYNLPTATATVLGGVKPVAKTTAMTQDVGVDANGKLYTAPGSGGGGGSDWVLIGSFTGSSFSADISGYSEIKAITTDYSTTVAKGNNIGFVNEIIIDTNMLEYTQKDVSLEPKYIIRGFSIYAVGRLASSEGWLKVQPTNASLTNWSCNLISNIRLYLYGRV